MLFVLLFNVADTDVVVPMRRNKERGPGGLCVCMLAATLSLLGIVQYIGSSAAKGFLAGGQPADPPRPRDPIEHEGGPNAHVLKG